MQGTSSTITPAAPELEGAKVLGLMTIALNRDNPQVTADYVISSFPDLIKLLDKPT